MPSPSLQPSPSLHAANTAAAQPPPSLPSRPAHSSASYARPLATRQGASAFNQPLNLDTSNVVNMNRMFKVCAPSPRPPQPSPSLCMPRTAQPPTPPPAPLALLRMPALATLQNAELFNQPLSFSIIKVTNILQTFTVRSAPALPRTSSRTPPVHALCAAPPPHRLLLPVHTHHTLLHRMPSLRLGRAQTP